MFLEAIRALRDHGDDVVAAFPEAGPLFPFVRDLDVPVRIIAFPVLRKSVLSPGGLFRLAAGSVLTLARLRAAVRSLQPDFVYVSTLTIPHWLVAARAAGVPAVCHVHEAEETISTPIAWALTAPLGLAGVVIANSEATAGFLRRLHPRVQPAISVVVNGFQLPTRAPLPPRTQRARLVVLGRLSPRKGQDVAVAALSLLTEQGYDVDLELVGSAFRGYEWYVDNLRRQAESLGIAGRVLFSGFRSPGWGAFVEADIALVPSRVEPFGMVAVEAMAVGRPVVASRVGGLSEIVSHDETGLLCQPDDVPDLACAIRRLLDDRPFGQEMAERAAKAARARFGRERFSTDFIRTLDRVPATTSGGAETFR